MKFVMEINLKMRTIVGILKFKIRTNFFVFCSEQEYCFMGLFLDIYEEKNHDHVS